MLGPADPEVARVGRFRLPNSHPFTILLNLLGGVGVLADLLRQRDPFRLTRTDERILKSSEQAAEIP